MWCRAGGGGRVASGIRRAGAHARHIYRSGPAAHHHGGRSGGLLLPVRLDLPHPHSAGCAKHTGLLALLDTPPGWKFRMHTVVDM